METRYPFIPWRTLLPVRTPSRHGYGCRLCIAREGLRAQDGKLFQTAAEFDQHLREKHEQHEN
jgi:hypothetical protein